MKRETNVFIHPLFILGVSLMLIGGCKEDEPTGKSNITISTVQIPAGTFTMGSPISEVNHRDEEVEHQVTLSAFRMSKYEITNAEYVAFLNAKRVDRYGLSAEGEYPGKTLISAYVSRGVQYVDNQWMPVKGYENHPVVDVTWFGATEFATYAGGRLPTEAEWEYACRANTITPFNTGACLTDTDADYSWDDPYHTCSNTNSTSPGKTQAVGTYPPNAFGLYDMHGNVWEWCSDLGLVSYPTTPQTNPKGPTVGAGRVIRGGSWSDAAGVCRSAFRQAISDGYYGSGAFTIGFRVVLPE